MTSIKVIPSKRLSCTMINLLRLTRHRGYWDKKKKGKETYLLSRKIKFDLGRVYNKTEN